MNLRKIEPTEYASKEDIQKINERLDEIEKALEELDSDNFRIRMRTAGCSSWGR